MYKFIILLISLIFTSVSCEHQKTNVQKYKYVEDDKSYGLEPDGYLTVKEAREAGYIKIDKEWMTIEQIRRDVESQISIHE